jgi:hypothetical protein
LRLFRQRGNLEITLRLPSLENLFVAPSLSPFSPEYETYGDLSGVDAVAARLRGEKPGSRVVVTLELPAEVVEPSLEQRTADALARYCHVKLRALDQDIREVTRHGTRALLLGLVAVLFLNGIASSLETSGDSLLEAIAEGLRVTAWVILWVPIGLLVYDRWYYSRDRKIYRRMEEAQIRIAPRSRDSLAPLGD